MTGKGRQFRHSAGFGKRIEYWVIGRMLREGLTIGEPRLVLSLPADIVAGDIAPDRQRLLLIERTGEDEREIVVIVGWGQSMQAR